MPQINEEVITLRGVKVHNLKNLSLSIPRNKMVVITGPSGSGKSSLAFDTIYVEGQRRYIESLSSYARLFLEQFNKPDLESIEGLSPTLSIDQKTSSFNPRSTVGTVTEIHDYLRLLFSRIGKPVCYGCGQPIHSQSPSQIQDSIFSLPEGVRISILAPLVSSRKGEYQRELHQLRQQGFVRVRIDGVVYDLSDEIALDKNKKHDLAVFIDRLILRGDKNILATRVGDSIALALKLGKGTLILQTSDAGSAPRELFFSEKFACITCNISYPTPEPRLFSFNSGVGACSRCDGLGIDENSLCTERPECPECNGARLRKESLHFKISGLNISQLCDLPLEELSHFFNSLSLSSRDRLISDQITKELRERLSFLLRVGVPYLALSRSTGTLSGGELQRIRLASQLGSSLVGVTYILDEPSIGLHPKDHQKLLASLFQLRDAGNTILIVEHDRETIERADWILDLGPGAGIYGGEILATGSPATVKKNEKSITGLYLNQTLKIPLPAQRRTVSLEKSLYLEGCSQNNLKNLSVHFPLGTFICVTGVSGSGKSSLVIDSLYPLLLKSIYKTEIKDPNVALIRGAEWVDKVVDIDQKPIGRTPRSNPATYTGLFSPIRELFTSLPESKIRGYGPGHYSFNVKGGRCETCEGDGVVKVEMHFLPNIYVPCEICGGQRYHQEILSIRYKGKNITDVLNMTAAEAALFFDAIPSINKKLKTLNAVGLGYITLGQSATTLSGGEAQRIKLAKELSRSSTGKTVYILDEPTTGLHFDDIKKLVFILQMLVDQGNTVIVIEHNLDLIKVADYIIDMGPEGGSKGGEITATGTPEALSKMVKSYTGQYLKAYLSQ